MKTPNWRPVELTKIDNVTYTLHFEDEHRDAKNHFLVECDYSEEAYSEIKNFYWFTARVEATKAGVILSDNYLGGNCCRNKKEVMQDNTLANILNGYIPQMIAECQEQADINLNLLIAETEQKLIDLQK